MQDFSYICHVFERQFYYIYTTLISFVLNLVILEYFKTLSQGSNRQKQSIAQDELEITNQMYNGFIRNLDTWRLALKTTITFRSPVIGQGHNTFI